MPTPKVVCFGEVLWDCFPEGRKIGGAPLNVALGLKHHALEVEMISAVGEDALGDELIAFLASQQLASHIQRNAYPTGTVQVSLDTQGVAQYTITGPVAWDVIEAGPKQLEVLAHAQALVYGSLAAREEQSFQSLLGIIAAAAFKIFDVNLRPPHYSIARLKQLMVSADLIKFNEEEILEISAALESNSTSLKTNMEFIAAHTQTPTICVTRGGEGAIVLHNNTWYTHGGYPITVADTVGAGDAFLAAFVAGFLQTNTLQQILDHACAMGALVASKEGANPKITTAEIAALKAEHNPQ